MEIEEKESGGVTILRLKGRLIFGEQTDLVRDKIKGLVQHGCQRLVLNLQEVSSLDSTGLGVILSTYTLLRGQGGQLKLLSVPKRIRELLVLTELATVIESFELEQDAVRSFPGQSTR